MFFKHFFFLLLLLSIHTSYHLKQYLYMTNPMILFSHDIIHSPNNQYQLRLEPTGNFVLKDASSSSIIWETNLILKWPVKFWVELHFGRLDVQREAPESLNRLVMKYRQEPLKDAIPPKVRSKVKFKDPVWSSSMLQGKSFLFYIIDLFCFFVWQV